MDCDDDSVSRDWTLVDGVLTKPDDSITTADWDKLRTSRDVRLGRCDWTQVADNKPVSYTHLTPPTKRIV